MTERMFVTEEGLVVRAMGHEVTLQHGHHTMKLTDESWVMIVASLTPGGPSSDKVDLLRRLYGLPMRPGE